MSIFVSSDYKKGGMLVKNTQDINPEALHVTLKTIATIHTPYESKFGVPRQSGVVTQLESRIVFEPEFRNKDALRGIEGYDYLWLIWSFSEAIRTDWSPTVRPPRLGGNVRRGVFATRSPFRPNPLALSSVRLLRVEDDPDYGSVLIVDGADMMDGTPIYDIKPYLPFTDSHPDARAGFAEKVIDEQLQVNFPTALLEKLPQHLRAGAVAMLAQNPIPHYQKNPERVYGVAFGGYDIRFRVAEQVAIVEDVVENGSSDCL